MPQKGVKPKNFEQFLEGGKKTRFGAGQNNHYWLGKKRTETWKMNPHAKRSDWAEFWWRIEHSQKISGRKNLKHSQWLKSHPEQQLNYKLGMLAKNNKFGIGYVSKGQFKLFLEIKKIYEDAQLNYPIKTTSGNTYFADVAIPSLKIVIEYDGYYWHVIRATDADRKREQLRDFNLQADGWKVYHIIDEGRKFTESGILSSGQEITYGESIYKLLGLRTS